VISLTDFSGTSLATEWKTGTMKKIELHPFKVRATEKMKRPALEIDLAFRREAFSRNANPVAFKSGNAVMGFNTREDSDRDNQRMRILDAVAPFRGMLFSVGLRPRLPAIQLSVVTGTSPRPKSLPCRQSCR
jgi:hypothetical protein